MPGKTIKVDLLARVEGEGALKVVVRGGIQYFRAAALFRGLSARPAFRRDG